MEVDGRPRVVASTAYLGRDIEPPAARRATAGALQQQRGRRAGTARAAAGRPRQPGPRLRAPRDGRRGPLPRHAHLVRSRGARGGTGAGAEHRGSPPSTTRCAAALKHIVGQGERAGFQVPLSEAIAYLKLNDRLRWQQFVDLECGHFLIAAQLDQCVRRMEAEAQQVYLNYRRGARRRSTARDRDGVPVAAERSGAEEAGGADLRGPRDRRTGRDAAARGRPRPRPR